MDTAGSHVNKYGKCIQAGDPWLIVSDTFSVTCWLAKWLQLCRFMIHSSVVNELHINIWIHLASVSECIVFCLSSFDCTCDRNSYSYSLLMSSCYILQRDQTWYYNPEDNSKIVLTLLAKSLCRSTLQEDLLIILFSFLSVCSSPEKWNNLFLSQKPDTCPKKVFVNCTVQWSESSAAARGKNLCLRLSLGWSSLLLWTSISKKYPPSHKQTGFPIQLQYLNLHFGTVLQFVSVEVSKWFIHFPEVTRVLVTGRLQLIANIKVYLPDRIGFGRHTDHWRKFVRVWFGSPSACQIGALNLCFCRQTPRRLHCFQC